MAILKSAQVRRTVGGAAAAWPLAARAQQPERVRRIGVFMAAGADDGSTGPLKGFLQALGQSGWTIGRNLWITPAGPRPM